MSTNPLEFKPKIVAITTSDSMHVRRTQCAAGIREHLEALCGLMTESDTLGLAIGFNVAIDPVDKAYKYTCTIERIIKEDY